MEAMQTSLKGKSEPVVHLQMANSLLREENRAAMTDLKLPKSRHWKTSTAGDSTYELFDGKQIPTSIAHCSRFDHRAKVRGQVE